MVLFRSWLLLGDELFLRVSEPSFDKARGVRGGVLFTGGEVAPSVSFMVSRLEVRDENAENEGAVSIGEGGAVDDLRLVGFER